MAETVTWERLRELAGFRAEKGCAISLYLDLDPGLAPTAADAATRISSLLADGERSEEATRPDLSHEQRQGLRADFARIGRYFADEFSRDGAQGLAVFCAGADGAWDELSLARPVADLVQLGPTFCLAPLVPLVGRDEGAIVAVVGREQGQIYRLRAGRLEQLVDRSKEQPGQHDQGGWSQARYQRHIENLVQEHLRSVAGELDRLVLRTESPALVLVGAEEIRPELTEHLSHEARAALVGWTQAEAHTTPAGLLEAARPLLERSRAQREGATLERWRQEAGRDGRAASGWASTLEAASDGRVEVLLFQSGVDRPAWRCPSCGRIAAVAGSCPLDGTAMARRTRGLDLAVHRTLVGGGTAWAVEQRHDLEPVEGIGALLRF